MPYQPIPTTSALLARELGVPDGRLESFDINTTCLSFLTALDKITMMMWAGGYGNVLIVSSEIASRGLPWGSDPATAALFGDGAAAMVLTPGGDRIAASKFRTYPSGWDLCQIQSGGTRHDFHLDRASFEDHSFFEMQGRDLYRLTFRAFPGFVTELLDDAGWRLSDIDAVIPHQASPHAIAHMKKACGFSDDQVVETIQETGNMIAASIPHAFDRARRDGRIGEGSNVLILGTSAGLSIGGVALEMS